MSASRRTVLSGVVGASALALLRAPKANAGSFSSSLLATTSQMANEIYFVNNTMGPSRLTGSPQHQAYVAYVQSNLQAAIGPQGGMVFTDVFENFPRWTATSWSLTAGSKSIPLALYYPYCNGGFTGARVPLVPAPAIAAAGSGGGYKLADGVTTVVIPPNPTVTGTVVNLGTFTGVGSIDWTLAAGQIAYIDYAMATAAGLAPASIYTVNETYDHAQVNTQPFLDPINPTVSILLQPDLGNATNAGVLGVIVGWTGISNGNAQGQYNPFKTPFASYPPSSQAGSSPTATIGGIPTVWVDPTWGTYIKNEVAGLGVSTTITVEAAIEQVDTSTVWGILPGANYGTDADSFLICNTHTDGTNIFEENGGIAVFNVASYFAQLPLSARPKSMVFLASTGHFGHGLLGSGADWIQQHPQIIAATAGVVTVEHLGCREWHDFSLGGTLQYGPTGNLQQSQVYVTAPTFLLPEPGPADPALLSITTSVLPGTDDRGAILSGGIFFGEGGAFHAAGLPVIGYIPLPIYLCAIYANGGIDRFDPRHFHAQVADMVQCLLAMQPMSMADLLG